MGDGLAVLYKGGEVVYKTAVNFRVHVEGLVIAQGLRESGQLVRDTLQAGRQVLDLMDVFLHTADLLSVMKPEEDHSDYAYGQGRNIVCPGRLIFLPHRDQGRCYESEGDQ